MAQKRRYTPNKRQAARSPNTDTRSLRRPPDVVERARPVTYGKPFIVIEDAEKNTFVFKAGEWIPHSATIAECRQTCQVKELPQRVNGRVRYEVRVPEGESS